MNAGHRSVRICWALLLGVPQLCVVIEQTDVIYRHGVQVRVIGDLSLLPRPVQAAAARSMAATSQHTGGILNICFSYTCGMYRASRLSKHLCTTRCRDTLWKRLLTTGASILLHAEALRTWLRQ